MGYKRCKRFWLPRILVMPNPWLFYFKCWSFALALANSCKPLPVQRLRYTRDGSRTIDPKESRLFLLRKQVLPDLLGIKLLCLVAEGCWPDQVTKWTSWYPCSPSTRKWSRNRAWGKWGFGHAAIIYWVMSQNDMDYWRWAMRSDRMQIDSIESQATFGW